MAVGFIHNKMPCLILTVIWLVLFGFQGILFPVRYSRASGFSFETGYIHTAPEFVIQERRININARIVDPRGIRLARCYFKVEGESEYLFVRMAARNDEHFTAVLPALNSKAKNLQYRLVAINNAGQISKTEEFNLPVKQMESKSPAWKSSDISGLITVSTESEKRGSRLPEKGIVYSETIVIDTVAGSDRLLQVE